MLKEKVSSVGQVYNTVLTTLNATSDSSHIVLPSMPQVEMDGGNGGEGLFLSSEEFLEGVHNPTGIIDTSALKPIDSLVSEDAIKFVRDKLSLEHGNDLSRAFYDIAIRDKLEGSVRRYIHENDNLKDNGNKAVKEQAKEMVEEIVGLGPIDSLMHDDSIIEVMVNGPKEVYVEDHEGMRLTNIKFHDDEHVLSIARKMLNFANESVTEAKPICDARLSDVRLNVVIPPISRIGTTITIRKYPPINLSTENIIQSGLMTRDMFRLTSTLVKGGANILVVGSTGAGKTTTIKLLCGEIPEHERTLTIEDTEELRLKLMYPSKHIVSLECRFTGKEETTVDIAKLLKSSLRMRPSRIIVGEVRSLEAIDLIEIFNTGHDGGLSSLHANSARDAVTRLVQMILKNGLPLSTETIGQMVSRAIDIIVFQEKLEDGSRRITEIIELLGFENGLPVANTLYKYQITDAEFLENGRFKFIGHHEEGEDCTISSELLAKVYKKGVRRNEVSKWVKAPLSA